MISFRAFIACALGHEEWRPLVGMLCFGKQATIWVKSQYEIADTFTQMDYPVSARLVGQVLADYGLSKKNG